jgi:hypothetical protein
METSVVGVPLTSIGKSGVFMTPLSVFLPILKVKFTKENTFKSDLALLSVCGASSYDQHDAVIVGAHARCLSFNLKTTLLRDRIK